MDESQAAQHRFSSLDHLSKYIVSQIRSRISRRPLPDARGCNQSPDREYLPSRILAEVGRIFAPRSPLSPRTNHRRAESRSLRPPCSWCSLSLSLRLCVSALNRRAPLLQYRQPQIVFGYEKTPLIHALRAYLLQKLHQFPPRAPARQRVFEGARHRRDLRGRFVRELQPEAPDAGGAPCLQVQAGLQCFGAEDGVAAAHT